MLQFGNPSPLFDSQSREKRLFLKKEDDILCQKKKLETGFANQTEDTVCFKTMCLATCKPCMPDKKEHALLLFNGLGARKWKVGLGVNQTEFRTNILQIYPLLISVPGYTIWFVNKNKQFEQLSIQANTPELIIRILGPHAAQCLIIVPQEEIKMKVEERCEEKTCSQIQEQNRTNQRLNDPICLICHQELFISQQQAEGIKQENAGNKVSPTTSRLNQILGLNCAQCEDKVCTGCVCKVQDLIQLEEKVQDTKNFLVRAFFSTNCTITLSQQEQRKSEEYREGAKDGIQRKSFLQSQVLWEEDLNKSRLEDQKQKIRWEEDTRRSRREDAERKARKEEKEWNARHEEEKREEEEQRKSSWEKNQTQTYPLDFSMCPGSAEPPLLQFDRTSYPGLLQAQFYSILQNRAEFLATRMRDDTEDLYRHNISNSSSSSGIGTESSKSADEACEISFESNPAGDMSEPRAGFTGSFVLGDMGYSRTYSDSPVNEKRDSRLASKKRKREI